MAGTPPFWSLVPTGTLSAVVERERLYRPSSFIEYGPACREGPKFFEKFERLQRGKKVEEISYIEYSDNFITEDSCEKEKQGRTEDALASAGDEGRGKLRKWPGIGKHELIRPCPNGATRQAEGLSLALPPGRTRGTETS